MTANQLRYWELRWKQYYEYYYLQEQKRSNRAKERETERHNRASERIAKQELVMKRIQLSLDQARVTQEWAKISVNERAQLLAEMKHSHEVQKFLAQTKIATAELGVTIQHNLNSDSAAYIQANARAFGAGWAKGGANQALSYVQSIPGIKNYQSIYDSVVTGLNESVPGINVQSANIQGYVPRTSPNDSEEFQQVSNDIKKQAIEVYGPDAAQRVKYAMEHKPKVQDTTVQGHSGTESQASQHNGSNVIYYDQPGVRSTPPQTTSGGIRSSGVIYAGKG